MVRIIYYLSCLRKFLDEQRIENVIGLFSRNFLGFVDSPQVKNNLINSTTFLLSFAKYQNTMKHFKLKMIYFLYQGSDLKYEEEILLKKESIVESKK